MSSQMADTATAIGAILAGLAGCGWLGNLLYRAVFGGPERAANAAVALTGAAKVMVDELQEEVHAAREEARALRQEIAELRILTGQEIERLTRENRQLRTRLGHDIPTEHP